MRSATRPSPAAGLAGPAAAPRPPAQHARSPLSPWLGGGAAQARRVQSLPSASVPISTTSGNDVT
jgi:hypothetical protein